MPHFTHILVALLTKGSIAPMRNNVRRYGMPILIITGLFLSAVLTLGTTAYFVLAVPVRQPEESSPEVEGRMPRDPGQPSELAV